MNLTIDELKKVIEAAVKEFSEAGQKGRDGYLRDEDSDSPAQPRGFGSGEALDFSKPSAEGNRLKQQGSANFGPYTSEVAVRAVAESVIREAMKPMPSKRMEASAPFNAGQAKIGENGSVGNVSMPDWKTTKKSKKESNSGDWFDTDDMKSKKSKMKKECQGNILQGVYEARTAGKK